ncbi:hypothetical protein CDL15_Pgr015245 [Punica granatum]|uniref:Uncharacterized protein n=1 Tax=Punica granatum TaxID=22663 RepID=A0A218W0J2_PUNGR|nr:hypothetical protein CDL15_Pgr015245 [Punica granatum]
MEIGIIISALPYHFGSMNFLILCAVSWLFFDVSASPSPSPSPPSGRSTSLISNDAAFIANSCRFVEEYYSHGCYESLSPYALTIKSDKRKLVDRALWLAMQATINMSSLVVSEHLKQPDPVKDFFIYIIRNCLQNIDVATDMLRQKIKAFLDGNPLPQAGRRNSELGPQEADSDYYTNGRPDNPMTAISGCMDWAESRREDLYEAWSDSFYTAWNQTKIAYDLVDNFNRL